MIKNNTSHGNYTVEEYAFQSFQTKNENKGELEIFSFKELKRDQIPSDEHKEIQEKNLKLERHYAKENSFKISPIVLEHRGLAAQEEQELNLKIEAMVTKRIGAIKEEAYQIGIEEGRNIGREEVQRQYQRECDEKLELLSSMISEVLTTKEEILKHQKREIYELIKNLTKWVILKELKDDGKYIERLLIKLIEEAQVKANLLVKVGRENFSGMPEVLEIVQKNLGALSNVRVEVEPSIQDMGIILESGNGIINGSLEEQFRAIDLLFKDLDMSVLENQKD